MRSFAGQQEKAETPLQALGAMTGPLAQYCVLTVETCAYAGSGNVLKVQKLLGICSEHLEEKNEHQVPLVLLEMRQNT